MMPGMTSAEWELSSAALDEALDPRPERIALVTDFGPGPYIGQLQLLAAGLAPGLPVINLLDDLPAFRPDLAAYLLPGLISGMPERTLYLCVVDPGVGGERATLALRCGQNWFVGPDNGLLAPLVRRCAVLECALWRIDWRPQCYSDSFHGRDLFLPMAIALTHGRLPLPCQSLSAADIQGHDAPLDCDRVLYVDHYGNLITGLALEPATPDARICVGNQRLAQARTFCEAPEGAAFWYLNAFGLVEIAANQERADRLLGLSAGDALTWEVGNH